MERFGHPRRHHKITVSGSEPATWKRDYTFGRLRLGRACPELTDTVGRSGQAAIGLLLTTTYPSCISSRLNGAGGRWTSLCAISKGVMRPLVSLNQQTAFA